MKALIYTFRTVKTTDLPEDVFIFSDLKNDLKKFYTLIDAIRPTLIVGVGNASFTRFETRAVNKFHRKQILKEGKASFDLYIPASASTHSNVTDSFCNWTAYNLANYVWSNGLNSKVAFLHVKRGELAHRLLGYLIQF